MSAAASARANALRLERLGIDTYQEPVIYMRADCAVCRAEGFEAQSRIVVRSGGRAITATPNVVTGDLLDHGEAGLSESAWRLLRTRAGAAAEFSHPPPLESMRHVRAKVYGRTLDARAMRAILDDVVAGRYSDIHLAAFLTACAGDRLDLGDAVARGAPLYTPHAQTPGELAYALAYARAQAEIVRVEEAP